MEIYKLADPKVVPALTTPQTISKDGNPTGKLNKGAVEQLVYFHYWAGIRTELVNGETGDVRYNSRELRRNMLQATAGYAHKAGMSVINNVTPSDRRRFEDIGNLIEDSRGAADAIMVCLDYPEAFETFEKIRYLITVVKAARKMPVWIYENPGMCDGRVASLEEIKAIAAIKGVPGAKTSADLKQFRAWIENTPKDFIVLAGNQSIYRKALDYCRRNKVPAGRVGIVPSYANFMPRNMVQFLKTGELYAPSGRPLQKDINEMIKAFNGEDGSLVPVSINLIVSQLLGEASVTHTGKVDEISLEKIQRKAKKFFEKGIIRLTN